MSLPLATDPRASDYEDGIYYPSEDGKPMAETPVHVDAMFRLKQSLEGRFRGWRPDVYMGVDMFWYWEKGNRKACRAPDVFVALGIPNPEEKRTSFKSWREGGAIPSVIFEMASEGTWQENIKEKRELYEKLGVKEYFVFDPEREFLPSPVVGWRLMRKRYRDVKADGEGRWTSEELEVWLEPQGLLLRLRDRETGALILLPEEETEEERKQKEKARARAERERKLKEAAEKRAEEERKQKETAEKRVEEERKLKELAEKRTEEAEAEIARLRRLLRDQQ